MSQEVQRKLFQAITDSVIVVIPEEWSEIKLRYQIEGNQSQFVNTYLTNENGKLVEKSIASIGILDGLFRELQKNVAGNYQVFTECLFHIKSNGEFNAEYSYEPIDWDLLDLGWNFNENG
jgi:hypothetical protein